MAKTGESRRYIYRPGMPPPSRDLLEEGTYDFVIKNAGKAGKLGWKAKPGKFPSRMYRVTALNTAEGAGKDKELFCWLSASPEAFGFVTDLAFSCNYTGDIWEPEFTKTNAPELEEYCEALEGLLMFAFENEKVLRGEVSQGEFKGKPNNNIRWLPAEEGVAEASGEEVTEEEEAPAEEEEASEPEAEEVQEEEVEEEVAEEEINHSEKEEEEIQEEETPPKRATKKVAAPVKVTKLPARKAGGRR